MAGIWRGTLRGAGSVILERLADALAVIALLGFGLTYATFKETPRVVSTALTAAVAIGLVILGLCIVVFWRERLLRDRFVG